MSKNLNPLKNGTNLMLPLFVHRDWILSFLFRYPLGAPGQGRSSVEHITPRLGKMCVS